MNTEHMYAHMHPQGRRCAPRLATRKPQALLARFFFRALLCRSPPLSAQEVALHGMHVDKRVY